MQQLVDLDVRLTNRRLKPAFVVNDLSAQHNNEHPHKLTQRDLIKIIDHLDAIQRQQRVDDAPHLINLNLSKAHNTLKHQSNLALASHVTTMVTLKDNHPLNNNDLRRFAERDDQLLAKVEA